MDRNFSEYFEAVFDNYKKTYQKFMGCKEVPCDETLLIVALMNDMDEMIKDMELIKGKV
jgi:hypothetical protein